MAAISRVLPDGVVFFAYDLGGWGGYYVGFFTSPDSLERALAEFKVKCGNDDEEDEEGGEWYLQSPDVCVVREGVVSTLERFTRDNFPDVDTESWSVPQREILRLQKKQALRAEHLQRTFVVNDVRGSRKRKRQSEGDVDVDDSEADEDEVGRDFNEAKDQAAFLQAVARVWPLLEVSDSRAGDVPAVFLLLDNGLVGLATSNCEAQIPQGSTCYCLTVMDKFVSCESKKYISVSYSPPFDFRGAPNGLAQNVGRRWQTLARVAVRVRARQTARRTSF